MSDSKYGVFGMESDCISSYALISSFSGCTEREVVCIVSAAGGFYIDLNDGEDRGVVFNLSAEQMIMVARSIGCSAFIYGEDESPSKPVYYVRSGNDDTFTSKELSESIVAFDELEEIAPQCNELWEDLYFNDFFRECLFVRLEELTEEAKDEEEE